jgi:hypothetical protein
MLASEVERMGALGELLTADAASLGKAGEEHEGFAAEVEEAKARIRHIKVRTPVVMVAVRACGLCIRPRSAQNGTRVSKSAGCQLRPFAAFLVVQTRNKQDSRTILLAFVLFALIAAYAMGSRLLWLVGIRVP